MNPDDELSFGLIDDPTPPDPDAARLHKAVARGRQRLIRRRAIFGGIAASVALVLVGSGVAVAQRNDAAPQVQVQPATSTTIAPSAPAVREADMDGLHYTLTLETPVVSEGGMVRITFDVKNDTERDLVTNECGFTFALLPPADAPNLVAAGSVPCTGPSRTIMAHSTFPSEDAEAAPASGRYAVVLESYASDALPKPFRLMRPFVLRVLPSGGPTPATTTSTQPGSSSGPLGPSPTEVARPGVPLSSDPQDASPGMNDFVGTLTVRKSTTTVGHAVHVSLTVRNNTDHTLELARGSVPHAVGIVCTNDLTPDGYTNHELRSEQSLFFVNGPPLAPGDSGARSASFVPTADAVGAVTCEAVLLNTTEQWQPGTVTSVQRLTTIPPVSFTVTADASTTTSSTSIGSTTTTSTVASQP